jgi:predicted aspartyl protease
MARAVGGGGKFDIVYGFLDSVELGEARVSNVPVYIRRFYGSENPVDGYIGLSLINKFMTTVDYLALTFELNREQRSLSNESPVIRDPETIEFPMRLTSSGFLSGEVKLDGVVKPLNFIIDTGASISVLAEDLARQEEFAKFARGAKMRVYGAAGVADDVETLMLPKVEIGPASRESVRAAVLDLDPVNETSGFVQNGIIGGNFLRSYRVTFDFQRGVIRMKLLPRGAGDSTKEAAPRAAFS